MGSHPTSKARRRRQKLRRRYARLREDCQIAGIIETTPDGAVQPERVDPRSQSEAALPELVRQALREGWAVPEAVKAKTVAELLAAFAEEGDPARRVRLFGLLLLLDQTQLERDRAEEAGQA